MASLLQCQGIRKTAGERVLFTDFDLTVQPGERLGVVGPNGAGKTTLLRVLADEEPVDAGRVTRQKALRVATVSQQPRFDANQTVSATLHDWLSSHLSDEVERSVRVERTLTQLGFEDPGQLVGELSGGWEKRLALGAAVAQEPQLLLLDEPTNHLDLDAILWLERWLQQARFALLVVSHDRRFLETVARRMLEIAPRYERGFFLTDGNYSEFLLRRQSQDEALRKQAETLDNRVRQEVEWLRRGPKARATKARSRVDAAHRSMDELAALRSRQREDRALVEFDDTGRRTKRLLTAIGLGHDFEGRALFDDLDLVLSPGGRVGLVGPNGTGKTTLLRLLRGDLTPTRGEIRTADALQIVSFDQQRATLDPEQSLAGSLAPDGDSVIYRGRKVHVVSWARRFAFRPEQLELPVGSLSGGEQARLLVARLMLRPADVLLLDEPTNDLDLSTLELLEENLSTFEGALVLVSHDRFLMERVCTSLVALDGRGGWVELADVDQWLRWHEENQVQARRSSRAGESKVPRDEGAGTRTPSSGAASGPASKAGLDDERVGMSPSAPRPGASRSATGGKKLSYHEQREFASMEQRILDAEAQVEHQQELVAEPEVQADPQRLHEAYRELTRLQEQVETLYARWAELEAKSPPPS